MDAHERVRRSDGLATYVAAYGERVRGLFVRGVHGGEGGEEVLERGGETRVEVCLGEEEGVPPEGEPSCAVGRSRIARKVVLGGLISYVTSECHATEVTLGNLPPALGRRLLPNVSFTNWTVGVTLLPDHGIRCGVQGNRRDDL